MPAAEAAKDTLSPERMSYELAFHILPTVAEGEVPTVFQSIKERITKVGGLITVEEAPARYDLAYEIVKYLEGRNRKFKSAYFGWVRFTAEPKVVQGLNEKMEGKSEILRHLLIKLTKIEEASPFNFHEALVDQKVRTIDLNEEKVDVDKEVETAEETEEAIVAEDGEESKDAV